MTELITGVDLVEQMIRVAAGETLALDDQDDVTLTGWAMESRLYAEDPYRGFLPSIGRLTRYRPPDGGPGGAASRRPGPGTGTQPRARRRCATTPASTRAARSACSTIPMIAKLCTWGPDRRAAIEAMRDALDRFELEGIGHNIPFLSAVMDHPRFVRATSRPPSSPRNIPTGSRASKLPEEAVCAEPRRPACAMHRVAENPAHAHLEGGWTTTSAAWSAPTGSSRWTGRFEAAHEALTADDRANGRTRQALHGRSHGAKHRLETGRPVWRPGHDRSRG